MKYIRVFDFVFILKHAKIKSVFACVYEGGGALGIQVEAKGKVGNHLSKAGAPLVSRWILSPPPQ